MLAAVERVLPKLTRREWGELAIGAARRAGLERPDLASLRVNLDNQFAIGQADEQAERGSPRAPKRGRRCSGPATS